MAACPHVDEIPLACASRIRRFPRFVRGLPEPVAGQARKPKESAVVTVVVVDWCLVALPIHVEQAHPPAGGATGGTDPLLRLRPPPRSWRWFTRAPPWCRDLFQAPRWRGAPTQRSS